jgi:probable addiction module antidote protein
MTEMAKSSGITREALYKALRPNAQPRFDTISKVCNALGVQLSVSPIIKPSVVA